MDYYNQILSEEFFPYMDMTIEERNFYLNLLLHTKEISDSQNNVSNNSNTSYDIEYLNLVYILGKKNKENSLIKFEGTITNKDENRIIRGRIFKNKNTFTVKTYFYRTSGYIEEDDSDYLVIDEFNISKDKTTRISMYEDKTFEEEVTLSTESEIEDYIISKVGVTRKKQK